MKEHLLDTLEKAKQYTLAVAETMPEADYLFRPQGAGWTFAELLNHIGYGIHWWQENFMLGRDTPWQPPLLKESRTEVVVYLNHAFQELKETCQNLLSDNKIQGFYATMDHVTHHRGQAVVYLRCYGVTPPEYTY